MSRLGCNIYFFNVLLRSTRYDLFIIFTVSVSNFYAIDIFIYYFSTIHLAQGDNAPSPRSSPRSSTRSSPRKAVTSPTPTDTLRESPVNDLITPKQGNVNI